MTRATVELNGLTVDVEVTGTVDGPVVKLTPVNCDMEGETPGEYLLRERRLEQAP